MLSTIGLIAVLLVVFTIGFVIGRKPEEPINVQIRTIPVKLSEEEKKLALDILDRVYEEIRGAYEDDEEESDSFEDKEITTETSTEEDEIVIDEVVIEEDNKNE